MTRADAGAPDGSSFVVPLVAGLLGLLAAGAIWARESDQARERDLQAANQVALALAQASSATIDGLRGASAMVADDGDGHARPSCARSPTRSATQAILRAVAHVVIVSPTPTGRRSRPSAAPRSRTSVPTARSCRPPRRPTYAPVVAVETDDADRPARPRPRPPRRPDAVDPPLAAADATASRASARRCRSSGRNAPATWRDRPARRRR